MLAGSVGWPRLSPLKQVGVVAALAQLHHDVQQPRPVCTSVDGLNVLQIAHLRLSMLCDAGLLVGLQVIVGRKQLMYESHSMSAHTFCRRAA